MSTQAACTLASVLRPSEELVAREIGGELVIVPLSAGVGDLEDELYALNESARAIWSRLDGTKTLKAVASELGAEFEAPVADLERDALGLATELLRRGMLVEVRNG